MNLKSQDEMVVQFLYYKHYREVKVSYELHLDHSTVIMTLIEQIITKKEENSTLTDKFTDWESFHT